MYEVIRSYNRNTSAKEHKLKEFLNKGYKVELVTPFTEKGDVVYLEYILKESNSKDYVLEDLEILKNKAKELVSIKEYVGINKYFASDVVSSIDTIIKKIKDQ